MSETVRLCMGCMNPVGENGVCNSCGYIDGTPYLPSYLAPKTMLNDRYLVGKLLTYNGEGATYIAYDKVINEKVYIREFMPDTLCSRVRGSALISVNPSKLVQFKNYMAEFKELNKVLSKMRTLSHISPSLDIFEQNNTVYVVLEYIDGITLKHYLQDNAGELTWQQVKKLFPPIFTTLSLIHNAGITHRGISLDTIYYTKKGELKLTGFSIPAERTANSDLAPELFNGFAAPEQYSSASWQGTWTDVYAISAVLYRALTGCMPTEALSRIGNDSLLEPAAINQNIPSNISKVIMAGLKLNGDLRIQTITELVTKLFEQPEYMEQTRDTNTTTVIIPRQTIPTPVKEAPQEVKEESKLKIPILFAVGTFVILSLVAVVVIAIAFRHDSTPTMRNSGSDSYITDDSSDNSQSGTDSIIDSQKEPSSSTPDSSIPDNVNTFEVPNLVGVNFNTLDVSAWIKLTPSYEYSDKYDKDIIFEQDKKEGEKVPVKSEINVKVSKGTKTPAIPDYKTTTGTTISKEDYIKKLDALNIPMIIKEGKEGFPTDQIPEGNVAKISKNVGDKIDVTGTEKLIVYIAVAPSSSNASPAT